MPREEVIVMFVSTMRQLEKFPFWTYVVDFAESHNSQNAKWIFHSLYQDPVDENLYHVRFDVPSSPEKRLTFDLSIKDGEPLFSKVVEK